MSCSITIAFDEVFETCDGVQCLKSQPVFSSSKF